MWFALIRSLILARLIAWFLRRLESRDPWRTPRRVR